MGHASTCREQIWSGSLRMIEPGPFQFRDRSQRLTETLTGTLLRKAQKSGFRRKEWLMRQGYPSAHLFLIESGCVLLIRADGGGAEVALDLLGAGDLCGIEDALCEQPYELSARATTQTVCYKISANAIREVLDRDASVATVLASYFALRLRLAAEHMEILALENVETRVRRVLQRLVLQSRRHGSGDLILPITQGDLASLVGGSRQSVNRSLVDLRLRGIVTSHRRHISVSGALVPGSNLGSQ
jgi:CRP/FNR family transcriptional regulator, cyclic AMP receptor protein